MSVAEGKHEEEGKEGEGWGIEISSLEVGKAVKKFQVGQYHGKICVMKETLQ